MGSKLWFQRLDWFKVLLAAAEKLVRKAQRITSAAGNAI
jgi:hypothetical protein